MKASVAVIGGSGAMSYQMLMRLWVLIEKCAR